METPTGPHSAEHEHIHELIIKFLQTGSLKSTDLKKLEVKFFKPILF
jgi:hypothetical protein